MSKNKANPSSFRWVMLITGTVILLVLGSLYAWSTYRGTLVDEFSWTISSAQLTFSISMMTFCIGGLIAGLLGGKTGPKPILAASAVLMFAGLFMASRIESLPGLYASYGILYGLGVGMGYNAVLGTIVKWFPDKTGLASGVLLMGFGISSLIVGKAGARLIGEMGWRSTFLTFGIVFGVIVLVLAFLVRTPSAEETAGFQTSSEKKGAPYAEMHCSQMLRTKNFWCFFVWVIVLSAAGLCIVGNSATFADIICNNLETAATVAGIISICNGIGRVIFGSLFDTRGYRVTMFSVIILFLAATAALLGAAATGSFAVLILSYVMVGFAYGGVTPTNSAFIAKFYGKQNYALNFSIINLNLLIASYLPQIASKMQDITGNYTSTFLYMIVLILVGLGAAALIRTPAQKEVSGRGKA